MAKLKIVSDDGSLAGWFMSAFLTFIFALFVTLGFLSEKICDRWVKMGAIVGTGYIGQFMAWLAYKGVKSIWGKDESQPKPQGE